MQLAAAEVAQEGGTAAGGPGTRSPTAQPFLFARESKLPCFGVVAVIVLGVTAASAITVFGGRKDAGSNNETADNSHSTAHPPLKQGQLIATATRLLCFLGCFLAVHPLLEHKGNGMSRAMQKFHDILCLTVGMESRGLDLLPPLLDEGPMESCPKF